MSIATVEMVHSDTLQAILDRLNRVYANGEANINVSLPLGERGDTLADFIYSEMVECAGPLEGEAAWDEAKRVLTIAENDLIGVESALLRLASDAPVETVFKTANLAYANGEGRIDEDLEYGERGDTLAEFIRLELEDVCKGNATPALQAYYAIKQAAGQITGCICELSRNRHVPRP